MFQAWTIILPLLNWPLFCFTYKTLLWAVALLGLTRFKIPWQTLSLWYNGVAWKNHISAVIYRITIILFLMWSIRPLGFLLLFLSAKERQRTTGELVWSFCLSLQYVYCLYCLLVFATWTGIVVLLHVTTAFASFQKHINIMSALRGS